MKGQEKQGEKQKQRRDRIEQPVQLGFFLAVAAEDQTVRHEQKNPGVADEREEEEDEKKRTEHQRRSSRGWIIVSGTRTVPRVWAVFTAP